MLRRLRPLTSWLSIALLAMDVVVAAAGHSHAAPGAAGISPPAHNHACSHHHHEGDHERSSGNDHGAPADDCSLCRHFSQPAVIAAVTLEICGSHFLEPLVVRAEVRRPRISIRSHAARGPPAVCA